MAIGALLGQNPGYTKEQTYSTATQALYPSGTDLPDQVLALLSKAIVESQDGTELKNLMGEVIAFLPLSGAQIATGSYVGTGTYGSNDMNSLTFDFSPSWLTIVKKDKEYLTYVALFPMIALTENEELARSYFYSERGDFNSVNCHSKKEGNTIYWWSTTPDTQFNDSGGDYRYYAFK